MLALDVGTKTVGVAVSDDLFMTAQPVETLRRQGIKTDVVAVAALVDRFFVAEVVVGLPIRTDGTEGDSARLSRTFGEALREIRPHVQVIYRDERFTTVIAERSLLAQGVRRDKRKAVIDTVAAQVLLQDYLDVRRRALGKERK